MTLGSALQVLLRRWLVILLGLIITLGAAGYLYLRTPPSYQATARMLLLLPADSRGPEAVGSPFLYLPNGLNVLARIVSLAPTSREFRTEMAAQGLTSQFEVGVDTASPTLTVSVEGTDPDNVIATRDGLITGLQRELLVIQQEENAPREQTAHTRVYAAESEPEQISGNRMRGVLTVAGAGGLITLLAAFAIDQLIALRRARKANRPAKPTRKSRNKAAADPADEADHTPTAHEPAPASGPRPVSLETPVQDAAYVDEEGDARPNERAEPANLDSGPDSATPAPPEATGTDDDPGETTDGELAPRRASTTAGDASPTTSEAADGDDEPRT
jgi:capsular polysaccharide biosynthesis protein